MNSFITLLVFAGTVFVIYASPITNPLKADGDISKIIPEYFDSKRTKDFYSLSPNISADAFYTQHRDNLDCMVDFKLRWSAVVGSPVFSSPLIFPDKNTGRKNLFISTFFQFVELLHSDGYKPYGWPISFEDSSFQATPLIYDVDGDGNTDIGIVDKNANMFWVRVGEFGEYLEEYHIQIPKLKVKRDWADNLDPSFVDSYVVVSMFDHGGSKSTGFDGSGEGGARPADPRTRLDDLKPAAVGSSAGSGGASGGRRRLEQEMGGGEQAGREEEEVAAEAVEAVAGDMYAGDDFRERYVRWSNLFILLMYLSRCGDDDELVFFMHDVMNTNMFCLISLQVRSATVTWCLPVYMLCSVSVIVIV
jgi:hypothetical protein